MDVENLPAAYGGMCSCDGGCLPPPISASESTTKVEIAARAKHEVTVAVDGSGGDEGDSMVEVEWFTAKNDLGFEVKYLPAGISGDDKKETRILVPYERLNYSDKRYKEYFRIAKSDQPGSVQVTWDNSYSMFTGKSLNCSVIVSNIVVEEAYEETKPGE